MDEWYDYYFENEGRCPACKRRLSMHNGCVNWDCEDNKKRRKEKASKGKRPRYFGDFHLRMIKWMRQEKLRIYINEDAIERFETRFNTKIVRERFQE